MTDNKTSPHYKWLVFIYSLSPASDSNRVRIWRKLKKLGMVSFRNSVYFLPYSEEHFEICQWLCQEIQEAGGEATLLKVEKMENMSDDEVVALFNTARGGDYAALIEKAEAWLEKVTSLSPEEESEAGDGKTKVSLTDRMRSLLDELRNLDKKAAEIRKVDFFNSPEGARAAELINSCHRKIYGYYKTKDAAESMAAAGAQAILDTEEYRGRMWVTRPRPHVDRIATAWAISRFLDPGAMFGFASDLRKTKDAVPFDYPRVDISHHGEDCTLETLIKKFGISDKVLLAVAEVVHDADLKDSKFRREEAIGLDTILKGLAAGTANDHILLELGFGFYDALYLGLGGKSMAPRASRRRQIKQIIPT